MRRLVENNDRKKSFERYMRAGVLWFHWTGSYRSRLRGFWMYSSGSGYCL